MKKFKKLFSSLLMSILLLSNFSSVAFAAITAPKIDPAGGTYYHPVAISVPKPADNIDSFYTTDGSAPTPDNPNAERYRDPRDYLYESTTVKAQGWKNSESSQVVTANYVIKEPTLSDRRWYSEFNPKRERYVAVNASNGDGSQGNPWSLAQAVKNAKPGDLVWVKGGHYKKAGAYTEITASGTRSNPIVYRAVPGEHVEYEGMIDVKGSYVWVWGFDIHDKNDIVNFDRNNNALWAHTPGVRFINNFIHDQADSKGLKHSSGGPENIFYGNITYSNGDNPSYMADAGRYKHHHNIYTQNNYQKTGYVYFVNNLMLNADGRGGNYIFHAYGEGSPLTGYFMYNNIAGNLPYDDNKGSFLIGGYSGPVVKEFIDSNYFYDVEMKFGYARPESIVFTNNYAAHSSMLLNNHWGQGEQKYTEGWYYDEPSIITNNQFYGSKSHWKGTQITLNPMAYRNNGGTLSRTYGVKLRPIDNFNNNVYAPKGQFSFGVGKDDYQSKDLGGWQSITQQYGNKFDANSKVVSMPTSEKVVLIANEYEPNRTHMAIYNWANKSTVKVDLSQALNNGDNYSIVKAVDPFGTPVVSGKYSGPVNVPVNGEFDAYLVFNHSDNPPPIVIVEPDPIPTGNSAPSNDPTPEPSDEPAPVEDPAPVNDNVKSYLQFDGSDDYVNLGNLDISGSAMTLEAWINPASFDSCSSYHDCRIISKATGTDEQAHYWMLSPIKQGGDTRLRFRLKVGGSTKTFISNSGDIKTNEWTHVAASYDGSSVRLYINGQEVGTSSASGNIDTSGDVLAWIGESPTTPGTRPWHGSISDVRIWNTARSADDIKNNMTKNMAGQSGLLAFYGLNHTPAQIIPDDSSGNNVAVLGIGDTADNSDPVWKQGSATDPVVDNCPADINQDGKINIFDYGILAKNFFSNNPDNPRADINKDGKVNIFDYGILAKNFFKDCS
jgi:hypothetical protein